MALIFSSNAPCNLQKKVPQTELGPFTLEELIIRDIPDFKKRSPEQQQTIKKIYKKGYHSGKKTLKHKKFPNKTYKL